MARRQSTGRPAEGTGRVEDEADGTELRAVDGRVPGRRGQATRRRLLDCTARLLADASYRDLKVVDIAREAGTSPATFYQYFPDVTVALVSLAEEMASDGNVKLVELVRSGSWDGADGYATAVAIAEGFLTFWESNAALMRVIELTVAEGDQRFRSIRLDLLHEFTVALAKVISSEQASRGQTDLIDPMATASVLVSMLAHVAAHREGFESYGMDSAQLRASMAHIVWTTVTGQPVPAGR